MLGIDKWSEMLRGGCENENKKNNKKNTNEIKFGKITRAK